MYIRYLLIKQIAINLQMETFGLVFFVLLHRIDEFQLEIDQSVDTTTDIVKTAARGENLINDTNKIFVAKLILKKSEVIIKTEVG